MCASQCMAGLMHACACAGEFMRMCVCALACVRVLVLCVGTQRALPVDEARICLGLCACMRLCVHICTEDECVCALLHTQYIYLGCVA